MDKIVKVSRVLGSHSYTEMWESERQPASKKCRSRLLKISYGRGGCSDTDEFRIDFIICLQGSQPGLFGTKRRNTKIAADKED